MQKIGGKTAYPCDVPVLISVYPVGEQNHSGSAHTFPVVGNPQLDTTFVIRKYMDLKKNAQL